MKDLNEKKTKSAIFNNYSQTAKEENSFSRKMSRNTKKIVKNFFCRKFLKFEVFDSQIGTNN